MLFLVISVNIKCDASTWFELASLTNNNQIRAEVIRSSSIEGNFNSTPPLLRRVLLPFFSKRKFLHAMEIHPTFAPLRYFSRGMRVLRVGGGSTLYICCSEGTTQFQLYHSVYTIYKDFDELPQRRSLLSSGGPTSHNMQDVTWLG